MAKMQPIRHLPSWRLDRTTVLARYVFGEFVRGWLLALGSITLLMLLAMGGQKLVTSQESGFAQVVQVLWLFVPMMLPYTIPFSLLVAVTLTFGRLSSDNEISAIRTSGVHLLSVTAPILGLALLLSGAIFVLSDRVVPQSWHKQRIEFLSMMESGAALRMLGVRGQSMTFQRGATKSHIYVNDLEGDRFSGVLYHETEAGRIKRTLYAQTAQLKLNRKTEKLELWFYNVTVHNYDTDEPHKASTLVLNSERFPSPISLTDTDPSEREAEYNEMSIAQLRETRIEKTEHAARLAKNLPALQEESAEALKAGTKNLKRVERHVRKIDVEIQQRPAVALSCFSFAMVAIPMGILVRKGNKMVAFLISVLLVILIYYPLLVGGQVVAQAGLMPASVAMWMANAVLLTIGSVLLIRVLRQ